MVKKMDRTNLSGKTQQIKFEKNKNFSMTVQNTANFNIYDYTPNSDIRVSHSWGMTDRNDDVEILWKSKIINGGTILHDVGMIKSIVGVLDPRVDDCDKLSVSSIVTNMCKIGN